VISEGRRQDKSETEARKVSFLEGTVVKARKRR
jgi:hypothetical protein